MGCRLILWDENALTLDYLNGDTGTQQVGSSGTHEEHIGVAGASGGEKPGEGGLIRARDGEYQNVSRVDVGQRQSQRMQIGRASGLYDKEILIAKATCKALHLRND